MTVAEALAMLSSNGNLVKRPLLFSPSEVLVGFQEERWRKLS